MSLEVTLGPGVRLCGSLLVGGAPLRVLRLSPEAAALVRTWWCTPYAEGLRAERLARRLHDAGLAVVRPRTTELLPEQVTVVVPARDRLGALERCLRSVGDCGRLLVVDDASVAAEPLAALAGRCGAQVLRRERNGGPAAARNTGLAAVRTPYAAFVDSDCVLPPDWLAGLLPHLADPRVAVVAPRVLGAGGRGLLARYEVASGPLDLGPHPAVVHPGGRVSYVPGAVLVAHREELGDGFDADLRVGEDVDLVWRLTEQGREVRYEPRVVVRHATRAGLLGWLGQRYGYGVSSGLLDARHPGRVAPAVLSRWSLPLLAAVALRRPGAALACLAGNAALLAARLPRAPGRCEVAVRLAAAGAFWTLTGVGEAVVRPWLPAALVMARGRGLRVVMAAVLLRLVRARAARGRLPLPVWAGLRLADDLAYDAGVWVGALRTGRWGGLLPRIG